MPNNSSNINKNTAVFQYGEISSTILECSGLAGSVGFQQQRPYLMSDTIYIERETRRMTQTNLGWNCSANYKVLHHIYICDTKCILQTDIITGNCTMNNYTSGQSVVHKRRRAIVVYSDSPFEWMLWIDITKAVSHRTILKVRLLFVNNYI